MQKQEKMAPPQFMSTHPSVSSVEIEGCSATNVGLKSYNREEAIRGW